MEQLLNLVHQKTYMKKIKIKNDNVADIINWVDDSGISLFERSLISRKFEISKFYLITMQK